VCSTQLQKTWLSSQKEKERIRKLLKQKAAVTPILTCIKQEKADQTDEPPLPVPYIEEDREDESLKSQMTDTFTEFRIHRIREKAKIHRTITKTCRHGRLAR
jgi:hypothetical protein